MVWDGCSSAAAFLAFNLTRAFHHNLLPDARMDGVMLMRQTNVVHARRCACVTDEFSDVFCGAYTLNATPLLFSPARGAARAR